jgi:hypothetical protein
VVAGGGQEMQDVFWYIKEAIDAYFGDRPFHVTVKAGLVVGKKPQRLDPADPFTADSITTPVPLVDADQDSPFDHIETGLPWPPRDIASGSVVEDSGDAEIEELASDEYSLDEDARAEQELDALIDGRKRPPHLIE